MAETPEELLDSTVRHQILVEGYKENESEELLLVAPLLAKQFLDDLNGLGVNRVRELTVRQNNRFIRRVQRNQEKVAAPYSRNLKRDLKEFAGYEYAFEKRSLRNYGITPEGDKTGPQVFTEAEEYPLSADGKTLDTLLAFWILSHNTRMGNFLRRAWADNLPNQEVIQQVRGTRSRKFRDGFLGRNLPKDVRFTVNTAAQHISSIARISVMRATPGVTGYRWVSVLDFRTSAICRSLDGQIFRFGKGPRPPAHPFCRSTISPVVLQEARKEGDRDAYRPGNYYDWLKRQPAAFQDEVLGPTRGKLLRRGGISAQRFADLNLDRSFRPRTLAQMQAAEPKVFERAGVSPPTN